jgi:oxygen-independent coproporphyrinogen III oxidase
MMAAIEGTISVSFLTRYEISNYAAGGRECCHNLNYWHNGLYLGFGPGAVSAFAGQRRSTVANLSAYCHGLPPVRLSGMRLKYLPRKPLSGKR